MSKKQSEASKKRMVEFIQDYVAFSLHTCESRAELEEHLREAFLAGMSDPESNWQANLKVEHGPLSEVKENEKLRELLEECEKAFESIVDKEGYRYSYIHSTDKEIAEAMLKKLRERKGGG